MASNGNEFRTRHRLNKKKAGRFPIRVREGPAKNLLQRRTEKRPASKTQRHYGPLLDYFFLWSKRAYRNLAGLHALLLK